MSAMDTFIALVTIIIYQSLYIMREKILKKSTEYLGILVYRNPQTTQEVNALVVPSLLSRKLASCFDIWETLFRGLNISGDDGVNPGSLGYDGTYCTIDIDTGSVTMKSVEVDLAKTLPDDSPIDIDGFT